MKLKELIMLLENLDAEGYGGYEVRVHNSYEENEGLGWVEDDWMDEADEESFVLNHGRKWFEIYAC